MSFLPHGRVRRLSWYGSFMGSMLIHAGLVSFVLFSGVIVLVPHRPTPDLAPQITVSLEILDANIVEELEPVDETALAPVDAAITQPDPPDAGIPDDLAVLSPDDQDLVAPQQDTILTPQDDTLAPEETFAQPDVLDPEPISPEVTQPEALPPEPVSDAAEAVVPLPETIDPNPVQPDAADLLSEPQPDAIPNTEDVLDAEPDLINPVTTEPQITALPALNQLLTIDDLSAVDDTVLNPLASGGVGAAAPDEDVLTLLAPDPVIPRQTGPSPETADTVSPIVLPNEPVEVPVVVAPDRAPEETVEPPPLASEDSANTDQPPQTNGALALLRTPLASPTASDVAIGELLRRIRATAHDQCTLALPRRVIGTEALSGLALIGAREGDLDTLADRIVGGLDFSPVQTRELLDPRQCATLDALRQSDSYPANRIGLSLDADTLRSGDVLRGRVLGAGGLFVTLLLVDDNGIVQDLAPFVTLEGTVPVFNAPVARAGPSRATRQMLLAIGTPDVPLDLSARIGSEAQDVFGRIPAQTLRSMVFGVATFDVQ